jgi:hypothetical protein
MCRTFVGLIAAGAFVAGGLPVAVASAAPAWLAPVNLAEEEHEVRFGPFVAMDAQGDAAAIWSGFSSTNETFRSAGGNWQVPGSLAAEGSEVGGRCMAMSPQGETLALRIIGNAKGQLVVQAVQKPPGGGWQAPVDVAEEGGPYVSMTSCHVAVDPAGDAVAIWSLETEFEYEPVWVAYRPAGGAWQPAVEVSPPGHLDVEPSVAIGSEGEAAAIWSGGTGNVIQAAFKPAGEDWKKPILRDEGENLSEQGHFATAPQVVFDSHGDAVAVWSIEATYGASNEENLIQASFRPAGGTWQTPVALSQAGQKAYIPQVAMDAQGDAVVVWELDGGDCWSIQESSMPAGGHWQAPVELSEAGEDAYGPQLAMDTQGDSVAVWELDSGGLASVQSSMKPAAGGWLAPVGISGTTAHGELFPQVAIDSQGDALAAWELYDGTHYLVQVAGYQTTGPELTSGGSGTTTIPSAPFTPTPTPALTPTPSLAPPPPAPASGLAPPAITAAGQSASIWREGGPFRSPARRQQPPVGTTFSFAIDEQASVGLAFTQQMGGSRVNGKCMQTDGHRHSPACKRTVTAGTLFFTGHAGTNKVLFQGRISPTKKLALGEYTLAITATNAAGTRSNTNSLRFTIVK